MNKPSKPEEQACSRTNPAGRLKQLQKQYTKRLAAERMQEVSTPALELSAEGFQIALERIEELERENSKLKRVVDVALAFRDNNYETVDEGLMALDDALKEYESA